MSRKSKVGTSAGTCFSIDIDKKQYLVTAKHVVANLKDGDVIELFHENQWKGYPIRLIGHSGLADVTVISLINVVIEGHELPATTKDMAYGQDIYFLGFPYGFQTEVGELNRGFPLPLVKKGIASTITTKKVPQHFLIDGHNNSGFSGGPVVFCPPGSNNFQVGGVISGYHPEYDDSSGQRQAIPNTNSGIIVAYDILNALELIKTNPQGTEIK